MIEALTIDGDSLTVDALVAVARHGAKVAIAPEALERAAVSRDGLMRTVASGKSIYGVNTGFGKLASVSIPGDKLLELQQNLIRSHASGVGRPLPDEIVRGIMLLRANVLLKPTSGARGVVAERLVQLLNEHIHPVVPEQGSVGASGDLAPLSHVGLVLMGEGAVSVMRDGRPIRLPAHEALESAGIKPVGFQAKEGLSFINGTQAQTAILSLYVHDATNLWYNAVTAAALSLDALRGTPDAYDSRIHSVRPHPGQVKAAGLLAELLDGSEIRESHREGDSRVQDAYSLRCTPQVLGPVWETIQHAARCVEIELNAATDNPLVFDGEVLSGGNFHGQPVAMALDYLAIALTVLAGLAERRIERLVNPDLSQGLPAFLTKTPGVSSGFMMLQIGAASLVAESRSLASPASVQSIPTDANQEDYVPMGMAAAFKAQRILDNAKRVVAAELIAAVQGIELLEPLRTGPRLRPVCARLREIVPPLTADRPLSGDIEAVAAIVARERLA